MAAAASSGPAAGIRRFSAVCCGQFPLLPAFPAFLPGSWRPCPGPCSGDGEPGQGRSAGPAGGGYRPSMILLAAGSL